jgi:hypothetical protein
MMLLTFHGDEQQQQITFRIHGDELMISFACICIFFHLHGDERILCLISMAMKGVCPWKKPRK